MNIFDDILNCSEGILFVVCVGCQQPSLFAATAISCCRPSLLYFVTDISDDNPTIVGTVMKYVACMLQ